MKHYQINKKELFGRMSSGREIYKYTIVNKTGIELQIINLGATIHRLYVPDRCNKREDVVMGKTNLEQYMQNGLFNSSVIGRCANRIAPGKYKLNGKETVLEKSYKNVTIHGASGCYAGKIFEAELVSGQDVQSIVLRYCDEGEGGFNGSVDFSVTYSLHDDGSLELRFSATPSEDTVINVTSHAYFNLAGHKAGTVEGHELLINADYYLPALPDGTPTGEVLSVRDSDFDFRINCPIGEKLKSSNSQITQFGGFDHCYCINDREFRKAASLYDPESGRNMDVWTDMPGLQLFTVNNVNEPVIGKDDGMYKTHSAVCLETQELPNAVNVSHFPSPVRPADERWESVTKFVFSIK